jgi:hypothetical protein
MENLTRVRFRRRLKKLSGGAFSVSAKSKSEKNKAEKMVAVILGRKTAKKILGYEMKRRLKVAQAYSALALPPMSVLKKCPEHKILYPEEESCPYC